MGMKDKTDATNEPPGGADDGNVGGGHGFAGGGSDGRRLPADGTGAGASGPR